MSNLMKSLHSKDFISALTIYDSPPPGDIRIELMEKLGLQRLEILKKIEYAKFSRKASQTIQDDTVKLFQKNFKGLMKEEATKRDVLSHFILRLVFCQDETLRRWFLTQECDLFILRFSSLPEYEQLQFLRRYFSEYKEISNDEFQITKFNLINVFKSQFENEKANAVASDNYKIFFKVPFEEVPDLVAARKIYINKGYAYVPRDQLISLIIGKFRCSLSKALVELFKKWVLEISLHENDIFLAIINSFKTRYNVKEQSDKFEFNPKEISVSNIDLMVKKHFPPCMRKLYEKLEQEHHLKHAGRQQLSLFFKGIGISLEGSIEFWKNAMSKRTPPEKFEREYAYNIRHNYGKEGKRANYTPYSCAKIISSVPGVGEHHGCPFKTEKAENLKRMLYNMNLTPNNVNDIVAKSREGQYQMACAMTYENIHGCSCEYGINHPNQYFDKSFKQVSDKDTNLKRDHEHLDSSISEQDEKIRKTLEIE